MRVNIILFLNIIIVSNLYSQYLPNWLEMGMTKNEIESYLNGEILFERQENLYAYVIPSSYIVYQFGIDDERGLTSYWIAGIYFNMNSLVEDFTI
jgi:hypothetical protein